MIRLFNRRLTVGMLGATAVVLFASQADAQQKGVTAGFLRCDVAGSISFVFGSSRNLTCTYEASGSHRIDNYKGEIKQYGIDIGYLKKGVMVWAVVPPTNDVGAGALSGDYGGVDATIAAGYGVGANALFVGYKKSIVLQPLSVEGIQGMNIAAAIASVTLTAAP